MSTGDLLSIEPQELQFPFELKKQISCSLQLSNKTDNYVAFKLKYLRSPPSSVQVPKDKEELAALQARLRKRFPVDAYNKARSELDPHRILSNNMLEKLFPQSDTI